MVPFIDCYESIISYMRLKVNMENKIILVYFMIFSPLTFLAVYAILNLE